MPMTQCDTSSRHHNKKMCQWLRCITYPCSGFTYCFILSDPHLLFLSLLSSVLKCFLANNHSSTLHPTLNPEWHGSAWLLWLLNVYERVLFAELSWYGLGAANHQLLLSLLTLSSGAWYNRFTTHAFTHSPTPTLLLFNFALLPHSAPFSRRPPATLSCFLSFLFFILYFSPINSTILVPDVVLSTLGANSFPCTWLVMDVSECT